MDMRLYLDSARMGLMSERARMALNDYGSCAAKYGCSLHFSTLLEHGFHACPEIMQQHFPALADWHGVPELLSKIRRLVGVDDDCEVLLANRSFELVRTAIRQLVQRSKRILTTDLNWPEYQAILQREARRFDAELVTVRLRHEFTNYYPQRRLSAQEIAQLYLRTFQQMDCDGALFPAISHDGIRLPADSICAEMRTISPHAFLVIDGAQAIGHVPDELGLRHCDVFFGGVHKWLCAHVPMGIALLPRVKDIFHNNNNNNLISGMVKMNEPLLHFVQGLVTGELSSQSETVNLASLFTTRAALADIDASPTGVAQRLRERQYNAEQVRMVASQTGWYCQSECLPTGTVMIQHADERIQAVSASQLRKHFICQRVSATTYENGFVRLAMPDVRLSMNELSCLMTALVRCLHPKPLMAA